MALNDRRMDDQADGFITMGRLSAVGDPYQANDAYQPSIQPPPRLKAGYVIQSKQGTSPALDADSVLREASTGPG